MTRVVAIHGIGNQYRGAATLHAAWFPALRDGLTRAGGDLEPGEFACAFYGDVFRPGERVLSAGYPAYDASDVNGGVEHELLMAWWEEAAAVDPAVIPPSARTLARVPRGAQAALNALSGSRFFTGMTERMMVFSLKQVGLYLTDDTVRARVLERVASTVTPATRVLIGHSLGSVVAYEALCANPDWSVRTFVTLGSPLGVRNVIFDRLRPPATAGRGRWPGSVSAWTNIADPGDVVALVKDLRPRFGDDVRCLEVDCGAKAHDVTRYLTAAATGRAVASGLVDE